MPSIGIERLKGAIVRVVEESQGIKAVELACEVAALPSEGWTIEEMRRLPEWIEACIQEERIIEVEYTVPNIPYRAKSFLLPRGSIISSHEKKKLQNESSHS